MNQPAKVQEPSMEEILASIRRIIADDDKPVQFQAPPAAAIPRGPAPAPAVRLNQSDVDAVMATRGGNGGAVELPSDADILELTEAMTEPTPPPAPPAPVAQHSFRTIDGAQDVVFTESEPEPVHPAQSDFDHMVEEARRPIEAASPPPVLERNLLSTNTFAAVDAAFNTLAHTVLVQNARTLEDLVREMLRPMLKSWLDDNLPGLVERLVRAEIERVSRGRG